MACNTEDWTQDEPLLWHRCICVVRCASAITHHAVLLCGDCFGENQVLAQARRRMAVYYSQMCSLVPYIKSDGQHNLIYSRLDTLVSVFPITTEKVSISLGKLNAVLA